MKNAKTATRALATLCLFVLGLGCRQGTGDTLAVPGDGPEAAAAASPEAAQDLAAASGETLRQSVFAGGCFWCTEAVFEELAGVTDVVSGYAGGTAETANYKLVSSGQTDHAEAIRITFDPRIITYAQLLQVFFSVAHDPTQLNYQGPDHGTQYRSAVFYASDEEKQATEAYIRRLTEEEVWSDPIATTLEPLETFYAAETYHQDYVRHNPRNGYVVRYALPKIAKVHKQFPDLVDAE